MKKALATTKNIVHLAGSAEIEVNDN